MNKPLSPSELKNKIKKEFPPKIIEIVNELLVKNWNGIEARIFQEEVENIAVNRRVVKTKQELYDKHWLDFEEVFREKGWAVIYDRPGYNETYKAVFVFKEHLRG